MTCHFLGGVIICNGRTRRRRCSNRVGKGWTSGQCANIATKLCDFPVAKGKTCDKALCETCAVNVGADRDFCPEHARCGQSELAL